MSLLFNRDGYNNHMPQVIEKNKTYSLREGSKMAPVSSVSHNALNQIELEKYCEIFIEPKTIKSGDKTTVFQNIFNIHLLLG